MASVRGSVPHSVLVCSNNGGGKQHILRDRTSDSKSQEGKGSYDELGAGRSCDVRESKKIDVLQRGKVVSLHDVQAERSSQNPNKNVAFVCC